MSADLLALRESQNFDLQASCVSDEPLANNDEPAPSAPSPLSKAERHRLFNEASKGGFIRTWGLTPFSYGWIAAKASKQFNCAINVDNVQSVLSDFRTLSNRRHLGLNIRSHAQRWL